MTPIVSAPPIGGKQRALHDGLSLCEARTHAWFDSIVGDTTKAPPYMPHPVYSAEKSMQHFRRNQAPTLAALVASEGGAVDFIYDALAEGRKRWRPKHEMIAADQPSDDAHTDPA